MVDARTDLTVSQGGDLGQEFNHAHVTEVVLGDHRVLSEHAAGGVRSFHFSKDLECSR